MIHINPVEGRDAYTLRVDLVKLESGYPPGDLLERAGKEQKISGPPLVSGTVGGYVLKSWMLATLLLMIVMTVGDPSMWIF
jgi:hypothetical protein